MFSGLLEFIRQGGVVMYPLLACSVLALGIVFERAVALRRRRIFVPQLLETVEQLLAEGNLEGVLRVCQRYPGPLANLVRAGVESCGLGREELREAIVDAGRQEVPELERHLTLLGTIVGVAPLLGLLGTVLGMIDVFRTIAASGVGQAAQLAGGIYEALSTTAVGLSIAVPSLVAYNYFVRRVERLVLELERCALQLVQQLSRKGEWS